MIEIQTQQIVGVVLLMISAIMVFVIISKGFSSKRASEDASSSPEEPKVPRRKKVFDAIFSGLGTLINLCVPLAVGALGFWLVMNGMKVHDELFGEKEVITWTSIDSFGYTPNSETWKNFSYTAPSSGTYRIVCTQGYTQRNIPTYSEDYAMEVGCSGNFMPGVKRRNGRYGYGAQLTQIDGLDMSNGANAISLTRGQKITISVAPNILPKYNQKNLMTRNSGKAHFSIQKLVE